jgi:hypothetical protein
MNPPKRTADPVPPPVGVGPNITDKPPSGELPVHATDPANSRDETPTGSSQAARGQKGTMTTGRPASDQTDDRSTDETAPTRSTGSTTGAGSRAGSANGGQATGTSLADGIPQGSSQGLSCAQGSGGGADQPPLQPLSTRS